MLIVYVWIQSGFSRYLSTAFLKRLVYKVEPITGQRNVIANITYDDAILALGCNEGERYSEFRARMGQMHSIQITERYVILAENSYLYDPCSEINYNPNISHYKNTFSFEEEEITMVRLSPRSHLALM